jgi:hypothetical protein
MSASLRQVKDFKGVNVSFVEYQQPDSKLFDASLKGASYHFSPYYLQATPIKHLDTPQTLFEHAIALDLILSVTTAFRDSQALAAHNLWNLYMGEELRDALPALIINAGFTEMW